jgi:hypothetical protein
MLRALFQHIGTIAPKHRLPVGFIVPAKPVERLATGDRRVHESKHDGYRLIVRNGLTARLFTPGATIG